MAAIAIFISRLDNDSRPPPVGILRPYPVGRQTKDEKSEDKKKDCPLTAAFSKGHGACRSCEWCLGAQVCRPSGLTRNDIESRREKGTPDRAGNDPPSGDELRRAVGPFRRVSEGV